MLSPTMCCRHKYQWASGSLSDCQAILQAYKVGVMAPGWVGGGCGGCYLGQMAGPQGGCHGP